MIEIYIEFRNFSISFFSSVVIVNTLLYSINFMKYIFGRKRGKRNKESKERKDDLNDLFKLAKLFYQMFSNNIAVI